jgi:hypothetical protein
MPAPPLALGAHIQNLHCRRVAREGFGKPDFDSSEYIGGVDVKFGVWHINGLAMSGRSHGRKYLDTWNMQ